MNILHIFFKRENFPNDGILNSVVINEFQTVYLDRNDLTVVYYISTRTLGVCASMCL